MEGFSLHAAAVCEAYQRSRLERLCRYITRLPIATKRLSLEGQGGVVYQYKHPFRDGSTHVAMELLDFMARLAALVPRPRLNMTRFHGVFAPNFKHWTQIGPGRARGMVDCDKPVAPMNWIQRFKRVLAIDIETCPDCGGKLRVIAYIEEPALIARILGHVQQRHEYDTQCRCSILGIPEQPGNCLSDLSGLDIDALSNRLCELAPGLLSYAERIFTN